MVTRNDTPNRVGGAPGLATAGLTGSYGREGAGR